jgi:putative phosphoribosyl transferase
MDATVFQDRRHAGRVLADKVAALQISDGVVLALPRGGVPVAYEVAQRCDLPLDVVVVRKLGFPGQPELAMGAIASGGTQVINDEIVQELQISAETLAAVADRELVELKRQERAFREGRPPEEITGRTAILVDDGLATGASMRAAVMSVRARARQVIVAVPVGAVETCHTLSNEADAIVCAATPEPFGAVGRFYGNFDPTSDDEVRTLLREAHREYLAHHLV